MDPAARLVTLPPRVGVDLGGIAKGMAVDAAVERLSAAGLGPVMVNAGGDLRVQGRPPGGGDWWIAIDGPRSRLRVPLATVARAAGFTAYGLLTGSVVLGLALGLRWRSPRWPRWATTELHRFVTLLTLVFLGLHVVLLALDGYMRFRPVELLVPFANHYRPLWTGLGVVAAWPAPAGRAPNGPWNPAPPREFDPGRGDHHAWPMAEWIYFLHPPRDDFAATMTDEERAAFAAHAAWLGRLLADGVLILAGPTLGKVNTGIGIFEAPDEETAQAIIGDDPVARGGFARAELRPYQLGFLRGQE